MGNIAEVAQFDPTVHQIEIAEDLTGGAGGNLNLATAALANRTQYLKNAVDGVHTISDSSAPGSSSGGIDSILGWLANRIVAITGKSHWTDTPDTTLAAAASHAASTSDPHGTLKIAYPVGSLWFNTSTNANPATVLGFGTWVPCAPGRMLLGVGTGPDGTRYTNGQTGGEATHILTEDEMPSHTHKYTQKTGTAGSVDSYSGDSSVPPNAQTSGATGGDQPHNNMPPWFALYVWTRTA